MRYSESEIVEDVLKHIRQAGGEFREWRVGTAGNAGDREKQWTVNSGQCSMGAGPTADGEAGSARVGHEPVADPRAESTQICREAYTTFAAQEVVERLTQGFGLQPDRGTTRAAASPRPYSPRQHHL